MSKYSRDEVMAILGVSPDTIGNEIATFAEAAKVLSSDHPRLIDEHPMQWVGVFGGDVAAASDQYDELITSLAAKGIPVSQTVVRYIDKAEKTFIL